MQFKTLLVAFLLAFTTSVTAMTCSSHNYQVLCQTTHHCVNGHVTHIPGTYEGNGICTSVCSCPYPSPPSDHGHGHGHGHGHAHIRHLSRRGVEYVDFDDLI